MEPGSTTTYSELCCSAADCSSHVQDLWRLLSPAPARFQDGTIDFQGVAQLQFGFDLLDQLGGLEVWSRWMILMIRSNISARLSTPAGFEVSIKR